MVLRCCSHARRDIASAPATASGASAASSAAAYCRNRTGLEPHAAGGATPPTMLVSNSAKPDRLGATATLACRWRQAAIRMSRASRRNGLSGSCSPRSPSANARKQSTSPTAHAERSSSICDRLKTGFTVRHRVVPSGVARLNRIARRLTCAPCPMTHAGTARCNEQPRVDLSGPADRLYP